MITKPEPKLGDKLRGALRLKQYSPRTEEITAFLTHLAVHNHLPQVLPAG